MITAVTQLRGAVNEWTVNVPVTLAEFKAQARIDTSDEDTWMTDALLRATDWVQRAWTDRQLILATYTLFLPTFPGGKGIIKMPRPPLVTIETVKFFNTSEVLTTFSSASYQVNIRPQVGTVRPVLTAVWPITQIDKDNAVEIEYTTGYANAAAVPDSIKHAIVMLAAHWYENREAALVGTISKEVEFGVKMLLAPFRGMNV